MGTVTSGLAEHTTELLAELDATRARTLALVAGVPTPELERVHSTLMSPLVWDLAHIAAFEDLWLVRRGGEREMLRPGLAHVYDAFETPRAQRGDLPMLDAAGARAYLADVRGHVAGRAAAGDPPDPRRLELVLRHEQQHTETMLQTIELAHFDPAWLPPRAAPPVEPAPTRTDWIEVPGGRAEIGAGPDGFAYDNERGRHTVELAPFLIGRRPVTNASFLSFAEGGGYVRREWWSDEGWAWKEDWDITHPREWTGDGREWRAGEGYVAIDPERPVSHVSWYEADAFARAHGARLPTEQEWERAAQGSDPERANLDGRALGTARATLASAAPSGALQLLGDLWEWTASSFEAYPGFRPDPYPEYSEVFFGGPYRVLRGGSWATRRRVATVTFRNWDLPGRRQIFSGFRLARGL
jgi:iron(II)-dependent oxidoreductase